MDDSVLILKGRALNCNEWQNIRAYAIKSDLDSDLSMLMRLLPEWQFDVEKVEYVG